MYIPPNLLFGLSPVLVLPQGACLTPCFVTYGWLQVCTVYGRQRERHLLTEAETVRVDGWGLEWENRTTGTKRRKGKEIVFDVWLAYRSLWLSSITLIIVQPSKDPLHSWRCAPYELRLDCIRHYAFRKGLIISSCVFGWGMRKIV